MKKLSLCCGLLVLSYFSIRAQAQTLAPAVPARAQHLSFKHLTIEDGLSQNTVTDIRQDSLGMLWVSTQNGLNRYNGYEFETFESNTYDSLTLSSNFVNCLEPGLDNTMWIGTKRGLCQWNQKSGNIFRMDGFFTDDHLKGQYDIGDILLDTDGGVWIMGENKGFHIFYKKKNEQHFSKMLTLNNSPGNNVGFYGQIMEDASGNIWIGTSRFGLWIFSKQDKSLSHVELNAHGNPPVTSVLQDKNGQIWVGTFAGLFVSKNNGQDFEPIKDLDSTIIRCLYHDRLKRVWVGTDNNGLLLYHHEKNEFTAFDHTISDPASLLHNSVRCVFLDQQHILWVGTYAGGLNYHNPNANAFQVYQAGISKKNLSDNSVTAFAEDRPGHVWIATDRGGLNLLNLDDETFRYFRTDNRNPASISSDIVQHISPAADGNLWIAHWATGLDYFDQKSQRFYHYTHQPERPGSLSSNSINYIFEDSKKNLWLATNAGLNFLDYKQLTQPMPATLSFQVYKNNPSALNSLSDSYIKTIFEDKQKRIWVGSWEGVNLWNAQTSTFMNYKNNPDRLKVFTKDYILCIGQGETFNMLLGTNENGLLYYIPAKDSLIFFNKQNGFPSNTIVGMQQDHHGLWWISTTNGLVRFNEKDFTFSHYNRYDGLPSNEFRQNATARLRSGKLLFGGNNGFAIFHPDSVKINTTPPKVFITQFKVFNTVIRPGTEKILPSDITVTRKITLAYNQSSFGFQFIAINFTASEKNRYAYRLKGIDKEWNYVGTQRTANFSYVPPGEFVFSVKAANNDGVWSAPVDLVLIITPPWWATVWFKIIAICVITGGLALVYSLRTRQLHRKKKQLELLVSERTIELKEKNNLLSQRQEEIIQQKEELLIQRDHVNQQFQTIQTLSEIGQKITASLKKEELILQLYNVLDKLMDVAHFSIGHLDNEKRILEFSAITRFQSHIEESVVKLDEDRFSVLCVEQKKVIRIHDLKNEYTEHFNEKHTRYRKVEYASAMYLPLSSTEGSITGILVVKSNRLHAYSDVHLNTLKNLAAYIGIAFENANIYKAIEAQSALLTKQSHQLEEFDKLKTRFFVNISHEFKTPLTLIITPLEQMLSEGSSKDWAQMHRQLFLMHKNARTLLHLVNELLEIRNLESTGIRKVAASELDLVSFSRSVSNRFEALAKQLEIKLTFHHEQAKMLVWFDPDMIQKVLTNLYSNAFKYTPLGGSIETDLTIRSRNASEYAVIQIKDDGMGITQSELPYVFERFHQGDAPVNPIQQSSGIGLSLIKDLLHLHAGLIEVESERGVGTCFTILLPLGKDHLNTEHLKDPDSLAHSSNEICAEAEEANVADQMMTEELTHKLPQLLVVEDNADVRELLRIELQSEFRIVEAENGKEGINSCLEYMPDLVLSDVMMPVTDGIALCEFLKTDERTSHIPIILLTAKSGEDSQIKGLAIGADDYISKPFNVKTLRARIRNLIASRRKLHALFSSKDQLKAKEVIENIQDRTFIEKVDAQIIRHIKNTELNHEILGKEIGMSKTQLYRKLQSITGKTVHEYIRNYRLRIAHDLLMENPDLLIFEVAYEVGFKNPSYFSKSFYAFYHIWPNTIKKRHSHV